jgi:diguanylate cyclase (GGDEF)-like protein
MLLDNKGEISTLMGSVNIQGQDLIKQVHEQRIPGKAMLLQSTGNENGTPPTLFLFIPLDSKNPMGKLLGARLNIPSLIDSLQLDTRRELICVLNETGIPIYCNKPHQMPWLANLSARIAERNSQQFVWSQGDGEQLFTAYWSLFMAPHYQTQKWSIAVALPNHVMMGSADDFERIFIEVGVIALSLVILLSIFTIRRNMIPLEQLLEGTRQLALGAFNTRVEIHSQDEFKELGDAFNEMTMKLGNSFDQQAGLIDLSYKLQHAGILHKALHAALEALSKFVSANGMAVIHVESSGKLFHTESVYRLGKKCFETSASYPNEKMQLPLIPWKGTVSQAIQLLPLCERFGFTQDAELQLLPALVKDSVIGYLAIYQQEAVSPGMDKLFILTQFCDILASSLSNIRLQQRLEYQALHDPLTQLPNRALIKREAEKALARAKEHQLQLAIMIMDVDRFKMINDSMGHTAGDELLVELANRLQLFISRRDILSRFAGDEFVFLFTSDGHDLREQLLMIIKRLDWAFHEPISVGNRHVYISASKGIALYPGDGDNFLDLLKHADAAMYQAKRRKPGSYSFFSKALQSSLINELETEQHLINALSQNAFVLHYQPRVHLSSGQVLGAEALIRWQHPTRGLLLPGKFIHIAELTGLIEPIGNWVLKQTCKDFLRWRQAGIELHFVSINVSSIQLRSPDFVNTVQQILLQTGMPPDRLELEITETAFIEDFEQSLEKLEQIRLLGVKVAVDDFGTGYASLKYLKQLPADIIKIDRLFIKDLPDSDSDIAIISSLITLADQLGLGLVAEGIETEAQKHHLLEAGIHTAQGFLMSPPLPEPELVEYWRLHTAPTSAVHSLNRQPPR